MSDLEKTLEDGPKLMSISLCSPASSDIVLDPKEGTSSTGVDAMSQAITRYESARNNYYFIFRENRGIYYDETETRLCLSSHKPNPGSLKGADTFLVIKRKVGNEELEAPEARRAILGSYQDEAVSSGTKGKKQKKKRTNLKRTRQEARNSRIAQDILEIFGSDHDSDSERKEECNTKKRRTSNNNGSRNDIH